MLKVGFLLTSIGIGLIVLAIAFYVAILVRGVLTNSYSSLSGLVFIIVCVILFVIIGGGVLSLVLSKNYPVWAGLLALAVGVLGVQIFYGPFSDRPNRLTPPEVILVTGHVILAVGGLVTLIAGVTGQER